MPEQRLEHDPGLVERVARAMLIRSDAAARAVLDLLAAEGWGDVAEAEIAVQRAREERDRYRAEWEHAKKQAEPILGYRFVLGPQVTPPIPVDFTEPHLAVVVARHAWVRAIGDAVSEHDAWGLLRTRPDGDITLYDVTEGSLWAATGRGGTIHLLLAREASS